MKRLIRRFSQYLNDHIEWYLWHLNINQINRIIVKRRPLYRRVRGHRGRGYRERERLREYRGFSFLIELFCKKVLLQKA